MSEFEFLAILVSIIIGLGATRLLSGAGGAIYRRHTNPLDEVHMVWTVTVLLLLVLNWWVIFAWRDETQWSFDTFLVLIMWAVSHYMLVIALYPPDLSDADLLSELFPRNRVWFFSNLAVLAGLDIVQTAMRGDLFRPVYYLPFVGHYIALAVAGIVVRRHAFDRFFAWYMLVTMLAWSLVVRRFLS